MYRCGECGKFACFADMRGVHEDNPLCECPDGPPSRMQAAGERNGQAVPRAVHFRCAIGRCDFFEYMDDDQGEIVVVGGGQLESEEMEARGL